MRYGLLLLAMLMTSGCASFGNESLMQRPADWPPLTMTKAELISDLGPPKTSRQRLPMENRLTVLAWSYAEAVMFSSRAKILAVTFDGEKMVSRTWSQSGN